MDETRLRGRRWGFKALTAIVGLAVLGAPSAAGARAGRDGVSAEGHLHYTTISKVTFKDGPTKPEIVISGKHFGHLPPRDPTGETSNFGQCGRIPGHAGYDYGAKLWLEDRSQLFSAGYTPYVDCMGLIVTKYTDCEIVYRLGSFYDLNYGRRNGFDHGMYKLAEGDLVGITVNGALITTRVHYSRDRGRHDHRGRRHEKHGRSR
jgi:hypothetical protein